MKSNCLLAIIWLKNQRKIVKNILLTVSLTILLTGFEGLNSQFTCPKQPGVNCQSLDQVNTLIDQGKLAEAIPAAVKNTQISEKTMKASVSTTIRPDITNQNLRTRDDVMRLWIAPYIDTQGNYFSATTVYHVLAPGQWIGETIDQIRESYTPQVLMVASEKDHV